MPKALEPSALGATGNRSAKAQEASIALWLINSDISNPQLDDILLFANTSDFTSASGIYFQNTSRKNLEKIYNEIERPIMNIVKEREDYGILINKNILKNYLEVS